MKKYILEYSSFIAGSITIAIWAGSFLMIKSGVQIMHPIELAASRFAIAGVFSLHWLALSNSPKPKLQDLPRIALCGFIGITAYNCFLGAGEQLVSAGISSLIVATQPFFAALVTWLLHKQRPSALMLFGSLIATAGVSFVSIKNFESGSMEGVLYLVAAAFCSGTYFVIQRPIVLKYGPINSAASTMLAGAVLLLPWAKDGLVKTFSTPVALLPVLYLAIFASIIAYVLWMMALRGLGATKSAILLFLMAPLTMLLEFAFNLYLPSQSEIIGCLITVCGVTLAVFPGFKQI